MSKDILDVVPQTAKRRSMGAPRCTPENFKMGTTEFVDLFDLRDDKDRTYMGISVENPSSASDLILCFGEAFSARRQVVVPPQKSITLDNLTFGVGARDNEFDESLTHVRCKLTIAEGTPSTATVDYSGSGNPANGNTISVGSTIYEFSSDDSADPGRVYVELGATSDDSWTNFINKLNSTDQAVSGSIDTGLDIVTIDSKYGGDYLDGYAITDGGTGAVISGNLAGGTGGVSIIGHIW